MKLRMLCTSNSEGKVVGNTGIPGTGMEGWKAVFNPHTHTHPGSSIPRAPGLSL